MRSLAHSVFALSLLLAVSCAAGSAAPAPDENEAVRGDGRGSSLGIEELAGRSFRLLAIDGEAVPGEPPVTLALEGENVIVGRSGCNQYQAEVEADGSGRLRVGPIAATKMACPGPAMDLEKRYLEALSHTTSVAATPDGIRLEVTYENGSSGSLSFEELRPARG